ncbi:MAG: lysophospholipid acyltransferase family protein [Desulfobulbaceae bacterium]|nr:lysophospholipid acyltransferase family protein [Desulfobulbaceae bacterium]
MPDLFYKISLAVLPGLYVGLSRLWFSTCRLTIRDAQYIEEAKEQGAVIVPFWHYSIFYMFHHLQQYPGVALVSASRDGEYIARIAERLNFETVRGSSHRQGVQAMKKLLKAMKAGRHVGIVADGSQGPARVMQPGAVYLASKTGAPIFPIVWAVDRGKIFRSWDRTVLPLPFSRIVMRYGKPMNVPGGLDEQGIEEQRLLVEGKLNDLYRQVWAEFGKERHD